MNRRDRAVVIGILGTLIGLFVALAAVSVLGSQLPQPVRVAAIFISQLVALLLIMLVVRRREKQPPSIAP